MEKNNGPPHNAKITILKENSEEFEIQTDCFLVAAGRVGNIEDLGLELAGVQASKSEGIIVNNYLQTTNPSIYAVGDCASRHKYTHMADSMARIVIKNALFLKTDKASNLIVPWRIYSDPEVAHVGKYSYELDANKIAYDVYQKDLDDNDRTIVDVFLFFNINRASQIYDSHFSSRNIKKSILWL